MRMVTDAEWAEILEDLRPYDEWLRYWHAAKPCCVAFAYERWGCSDGCRHGTSSTHLAIHLSGEELPQRELVTGKLETGLGTGHCPGCGRTWSGRSTATIGSAHERRDATGINISLAVTGNFDEEAERARLMPV